MTNEASIVSDAHEAVRSHYQAGIEDADFPARLKTLIDALGTGPEVERQIAQLDHFHVRGRAATAELAALAAVDLGLKVLDAGSGLGGPSRYLATEHGCEVEGVDLSPAFVAIALVHRQSLALEAEAGRLDAAGWPDGGSMPLRSRSSYRPVERGSRQRTRVGERSWPSAGNPGSAA